MRFETVVAKSAAALAAKAAERIGELSNEASRTLCVALSGGSTPKRLYEALTADGQKERVRWDRLELFFGDERSVPPDHKDSNYGMAKRALLAKIPSQAHRMLAAEGEADAYEQLVRERVAARRGSIPAFDLVLLGMGTDGHTASLFPGTAALAETSRLVVMNEVPEKKTRRMTFTYPLLNAAERVWVLIAGADKRGMLAQCLAARETPGSEKEWPVLGVRPEPGELVWWIDEAAAGRGQN